MLGYFDEGQYTGPMDAGGYDFLYNQSMGSNDGNMGAGNDAHWYAAQTLGAEANNIKAAQDHFGWKPAPTRDDILGIDEYKTGLDSFVNKYKGHKFDSPQQAWNSVQQELGFNFGEDERWAGNYYAAYGMDESPQDDVRSRASAVPGQIQRYLSEQGAWDTPDKGFFKGALNAFSGFMSSPVGIGLGGAIALGGIPGVTQGLLGGGAQAGGTAAAGGATAGGNIASGSIGSLAGGSGLNLAGVTPAINNSLGAGIASASTAGLGAVGGGAAGASSGGAGFNDLFGKPSIGLPKGGVDAVVNNSVGGNIASANTGLSGLGSIAKSAGGLASGAGGAPGGTGGGNAVSNANSVLPDWLSGASSAIKELGPLGGLLSGVLSYFGSDDYADALEGLAEKADPWGPYRQPFAEQAAATLDPNFDIASLPGLKGALDFADQRIKREYANKGLAQSRNVQYARHNTLSQLGYNAYQNSQSQLANLGGAQIPPSQGVQIGGQAALEQFNRPGYLTYPFAQYMNR